jgi:ribosomal protein S18 acetylase RimI-like enzyme
MIRKSILRTTKLTKNELKEIRNLTIICHNIDKFKTKLYWNVIEDRKIPEYDDFLFHIEGNLVGYLSVYVFKEQEAELTAMVHPKYRRQGIFKALMRDGLLELQRRQIKKCNFICNQKAETTSSFLKKMGASFDHSEYEMIAKKKPHFDYLPEINLSEYTQDDVLDLAQMDAVCFNTSLDKMLSRFINSMGEKNRKVFVARHENKKIGKVHLRFDDKNHAYIHDLCILPEFRRQKFATAMVMKIMDMLPKKNIKNIYLDVEGNNVSAIKLYEQCGYETTAIYDFWAYNL